MTLDFAGTPKPCQTWEQERPLPAGTSAVSRFAGCVAASLVMLAFVCSLDCLQAQTLETMRMAQELRAARMRLNMQPSRLTEAELERLAETIARSNYLAQAIPEAIQRRDFTNADRLLGQFTGSINNLNLYGQPILQQAVQMGQEPQLTFLLEHKADPNPPIRGGQTVLCQAIQYRHWPMALKLIDAGASVSATNLWGQSPLGLIVENLWGSLPANDPSRDVLASLLCHGADPFAAQGRDATRSAIEQALTQQKLAVADLLLTNQPSLTRRTLTGETALHLAAIWGRTNAFDSLLSAGFSINQTNSSGLTPLQRIADSVREFPNAGLTRSNGAWVFVWGLPPGPGGAAVRRSSSLPTRWLVPWPSGQWLGPNYSAQPGIVAADLLNRGATLDIFCAAGLGLTNELAQMLTSQPELANARDGLGRSPLHYAINAAQTPAAICLLNSGSQVSCLTTRPIPSFRQDASIAAGSSPLHLAALRGNDELVRILLAAGAEPGRADQQGDTPLHLSARSWQTNSLLLLLAAHAPIELTDHAGHTALRLAVESGGVSNVELLLQAGAKPATGLNGETLLHLAAEHGRADVIKVLLRYGLALDTRDSAGRTPFRRAALAHQWDAMNFLLARRADVNAADAEGNTVLHEVASEQQDTIDHSTQPSLWDGWKQSLLSRPGLWQKSLSKMIQWKLVAAPAGITWTNTSLTGWLLDHGARPGQTNCFGQTPLYLLCQQPWLNYSLPDTTNRFSLLLNAGAKVEAPDTNGVTCLHVAATNAPPDVLLLLARRVRPGTALEDSEGRTPLHYAARPGINGQDGAPARVAALLAGGLDPNTPDKHGRTPVHEAITTRSDFPWMAENQVLLTLLTNRASPNRQDNHGLTPLALGVKGWIDRPNTGSGPPWSDLAMLITNHANPNLADQEGRTPLHLLAAAPHNEWAAYNSPEDLLRIVFGNGNWDPALKDKAGQAPVHLLASNVYPHSVPSASVQQFFTNKLAINLTNAAGDTPLHIAIRADRYQVAKLLLDAGANPALRNARGESAWLLAARVEPGSMMAQNVRPPGANQSFFFSISPRDPAPFDRWLEAEPAAASVTNVHGQTPLLAATDLDPPPTGIVEKLFEHGAPLDPLSALRLGRMAEFERMLQTQTGPAPAKWLFDAVRFQRFEALRDMVKTGADINSTDDEGHSLLHRASRLKTPETAAWLETNGCHETIFDAIANGAREQFDAFLNADAQAANVTNRQGRSVLIATVIARQPELAATLLSRGADINARPPEGWTALHFAAALNQLAFGQMLLRSGAPPDDLASRGMAPLHIAAAFGHADFAALLLTNGASVNLRPGSNGAPGNTPLHWAVHRGGVEVVKVLLAHGADRHAINSFGLTPVDLAAPRPRGPSFGFLAPFEVKANRLRPLPDSVRAAIRKVFEETPE